MIRKSLLDEPSTVFIATTATEDVRGWRVARKMFFGFIILILAALVAVPTFAGGGGNVSGEVVERNTRETAHGTTVTLTLAGGDGRIQVVCRPHVLEECSSLALGSHQYAVVTIRAARGRAPVFLVESIFECAGCGALD